MAFQQVGDTKAKGQGAFMNKGKGQVHKARLVGVVLLHSGVGIGRHLSLGEAADMPHLFDTEGHLSQLVRYTTGLHNRSSLEK